MGGTSSGKSAKEIDWHLFWRNSHEASVGFSYTRIAQAHQTIEKLAKVPMSLWRDVDNAGITAFKKERYRASPIGSGQIGLPESAPHRLLASDYHLSFWISAHELRRHSAKVGLFKLGLGDVQRPIDACVVGGIRFIEGALLGRKSRGSRDGSAEHNPTDPAAKRHVPENRTPALKESVRLQSLDQHLFDDGRVNDTATSFAAEKLDVPYGRA